MHKSSLLRLLIFTDFLMKMREGEGICEISPPLEWGVGVGVGVGSAGFVSDIAWKSAKIQC